MFFKLHITRSIISIYTTILLHASVFSQTKYSIEYLGPLQGLPSLNIDAVAQDSQGLMWFASLGTGIIRYDGSNFKVYNQLPESKPRLTDNNVRDVLIDHKGRLWVAHHQGIDILQPNTLEIIQRIPLSSQDKRVQGLACSLNRDAFGDIWLATYNNGIFRFRNGDPEQMEWMGALPKVHYINVTANGTLYCISSNSGLNILKNGRFIPCFALKSDSKKNRSQLRPIENQDGILTGFREIWLHKPSRVFQFNSSPNLFEPGDPNDGISVFTSPEFSKKLLETASPLSKFPLFLHAFRIFKDNQGLVWVAMEYGGVFKLKYREVDFTTCPDLKGVSLRGMIEGPKGSIYISSYDGIFQYFPKLNRAKLVSNSKNIYFNLAQLKGDTITTLSESEAIGNHILHRPKEFVRAPIADITKDVNFFASLPLSDEWILAGNQQLFRIRQKDLKTEKVCLIQDAKPTMLTMCFTRTKDGTIWIGSTEGVFMLSKEGTYEAPWLRNDHRLGSESRINDIFEDQNGRLWFATHNYGLICYDLTARQAISFDRETGFVSNETYKIASSQSGKILWVSTFLGLHCIELPSYKIHFFDEADGTSGSEFNTGSFLQTSDSVFYFGGVRGLTRFDPKDFMPNQHPPLRPIISEIFIEDVYSNVISTLSLPNRDTLLRLLNSQNTLEFHFGSNGYFRPQNNTYYVQLLHVDADWVTLGSSSTIKYYRLVPGQYTLRVKFKNSGDNLNSQIYAISFTIDQVFYKKWWFVALLGLLLIAAIFGIISLRKRRFRREEELRRAIAHDLHNTLGGKISSISNMIYLIDRLNKAGQPFQAELAQMMDSALKVHSTMSDVIWVLAQPLKIKSGLINRMKDYVDKWLKIAHIKVEFEHNISSEENEVPFSVQHEILLVYKEILGNILKHTFSEKVQIHFMVNKDKSIDLIVQNFFKDRKKEAPSGGQGLNIIQEHISRIGGTLNIQEELDSFRVHIRFEKPFKSWRNK